jgi:hypothetical protein
VVDGSYHLVAFGQQVADQKHPHEAGRPCYQDPAHL